MNTSEQINEIAAAMAKAQAVIENPKKDSDNPHFKSKYADLASGLVCVRPALSANGIALFQVPEITDNSVILRTRLVHSSGQWIECAYPVAQIGPHQPMGAALTYAKRQSLFALVGVCGEDDDDDGNAANTVAPVRKAPAVEVDYDTLFDEGERIARGGGPDALSAWWMKTLTANERKALGAGALAELKQIAKQPVAVASDDAFPGDR
jgi:hypothetical protein